MRIAMGLHDDSGGSQLAQLLERLSEGIAAAARALGASILMLPTYSADYENDASICDAFARLVRHAEVRIARIADPALYKAVTGRLRVLVSARMHPLILAAGMGTPIVGLAYNGKFEGMFDMLGIPRRMLWLGDTDADLPRDIQSLIGQALHSTDNLQLKSSRLADIVSRKTTALLHADAPSALAV
jgi:polysaccharide pyruvyl transferase WcaK-like protein